MSQNNKLFKVLDEYIYFNNALESQEYAKNNPGKTVVRNQNIDESNISTPKSMKIPKINKSPKMILDYLNRHIISQDEAKKEIALAMYYHSLKSKYITNKDIGTNGPVLIVGPTGSGKTFIVQKACEYIDTIFMHVDTANMVPEGIQGYSISKLGRDIVTKANYNMDKASHCVVFLDEMDKLFYGNDDSKYGPRVATQLLRLIEGSEVKLSDSADIPDLDTTNIQFILGGAFQWVLDKKLEKKSTMGFNNQQEENSNYEITLEDLYKENIPKELLGRMSTIVNLRTLLKDDYYNILTNSQSSPLKNFINKVEFHGDKIDINEETLQNISKVAEESELGVRAIKQILKSIFCDALFSAADGEYKTHAITYTQNLKNH
ncbi:MAG: AAA family ATPase [Sulfurimonas sp.]|nr:AAA family ATPase [Sulfurimonas sp.]